MLYEFTIEYYFAKYNTGEIYKDEFRTGILYAIDYQSAINKLRSIDNEYVSTKNMTFKEIMKER